ATSASGPPARSTPPKSTGASFATAAAGSKRRKWHRRFSTWALTDLPCRVEGTTEPHAWHNLRATQQTELSASFPLHVVCYWMGNKQAVAAEHYLQVTEADFQRGAKSGAVAVQIPVQQPAVAGCTDSQDQQKTPVVPGFVQPDAVACETVPGGLLPPRG